MTVSSHDHGKLYRSQKPEIDAAMARVLSSGRLDWGEEVPAFEAEFAAWNGATHAVTTNSGSAAIKIALLALGIGPGDEVITVANTDISTSSAIRHTGAMPIWVDIDPVSKTIDLDAMAAAVTPRTRAIVPVDIFGHPADIFGVLAIAARHGLAVVEDACLALGATIGSRKVGSLSTATCFSFAPTKHLGAFGAGGCVLTEDSQLAARMQKIAAYGQDRSRHRAMQSAVGGSGLCHETEGLNERLDEIQAAILRVKLTALASTLDSRRRQAETYSAAFAGLPLDTPQVLPGYGHAWRNYVLEADGRDEVRARLAQAGIPTNLSYAPPMHLQPVYAHLCVREGALPVTERTSRRLFGLPLGPHLDPEQTEEVVAAVRNLF
jgi:dTDP-4-amino-4,6-dideoxygalactose transaminase